uniref:zinc ribbon domain-containing protein n=1 Tax=Nocardia vinacea TaxID=96468 RepID=UPI003571485C
MRSTGCCRCQAVVGLAARQCFSNAGAVCGACRRIHRGLVLGDRTWECPGSRVVHDRDHNAARNLLTAMLTNLAADVDGKS